MIVNIRRFALPYLAKMCLMLSKMGWGNPSRGVKRVQEHILTILRLVCVNENRNQRELALHTPVFLDFLMKNVGAEQLLNEIYKNNGPLLYGVSKPNELLNGWTIVDHYCGKLDSEPNKRNVEYYKQGTLFVEFCETLLFFNNVTIDLNQKLVAETLFENGLFRQILIDFKI